MFDRLSFATRIMLLPALAAVAFLALVVTTYAFNAVNSKHLDTVENQLHPKLVLVLQLETSVKDLSETLAAAWETGDATLIEEATEEGDAIRQLLEEARQKSLDVGEIEHQFAGFYDEVEGYIRRRVRGERGEDIQEDLSQSRILQRQFTDTLEQLGEAGRLEMQQAFAQTRERNRNALLVSLLVSALSLVLFGWLSYRMRGNVHTLTAEVTGSATQINTSSSQVLATSRQQEKAANQHASAIEETRATIQSLTEASRSIAKSAAAVLENAQQTLRTNQTIGERNSHLIGHLEGISTILESVQDIANKSELLALNAALEGTKAGEAGRGFSLVAAQMQRLAENVMDKVRDIQRLTQDVRDASHSAVLAIEEGTKLAEKTTQAARQIRLVTQQQETAAEQVTVSMKDASIQVQQTVAAVRQSTQAMESLVQLASQLNTLLVRLRLMDERRIV